MEITEARVRYWSNASCILCIAISLFFIFQIWDGLPPMTSLYKGLRIELPIPTRILMSIHLDWIVALAVVLVLVKQIKIKDPVKSLNYNLLQIVVVLFLKEIYCYALFSPLLLIPDALSKK